METPTHHHTVKQDTMFDDPLCRPSKRTRSHLHDSQERVADCQSDELLIQRNHLDIFARSSGCHVEDQRFDAWECEDDPAPEEGVATRNKLDTNIFAPFVLSSELSDVVFITLNQDNREVHMPAHKVVMCAQSSVFRAMFLGGMKESGFRSEIRLSCPDYVWEVVLRCCYGKRVSIKAEHLIQLLQVADQYDLQCLRQECEAFATLKLFESRLIGGQTVNVNCRANDAFSFDPGNFFELFEAAILFNAKYVENICLQAIRLHAAEFVHSPFFVELSREALLKVLRSKTLVGIKEVDLFKRTVAWGRSNASIAGENLTITKLSAFLEEPLALIRYDCMPAKDIYEIVYPSSLVEADVLLQSCKSRLLAQDTTKWNDQCWSFQHCTILDERGSGLGSRNPCHVVDTPGVHTQVSVSSLLGWKLYYCASYSQETLLAELQPPQSATRVLVAARRKNMPNILVVCACCPSGCFGKPTLELDEPGLHVHFLGQKINEVYWYCVPDYSIGFSDSPEISINAADIIPGEKRMSWHLGEDSGGGYRCGNCIGLLSSEVSERGDGENWEKLLFWI
mmetsp:Transcript_4387/g.27960  ORF Transcript_4387/g.27960 Transcript_4387/m.27960 type:complete len:566 (+) Transcript_4387:148-1845(+)